MRDTQNNGIRKWLLDNSWSLITMMFMLIVAFTNLRATVVVNASNIEYNRALIARYPSEDWFNLKFETIEKQINALENK